MIPVRLSKILVSVKPQFIFSLFVAACLSHAQKPSDWRPSPVKPLDFGKRVDRALLNLENALGEANYRCQYFDRSVGQANFTNRIRNKKTFRVEFVKVTDDHEDPFSHQAIVAKNGKYHLVSPSTGFKPLKAGVDPGFLPKSVSIVKAWPRHFQQAMFQSYLTGSGAFNQFAAAISKPNSGYTVRMDSRVMQGNGRTIPQVRLFATRTKAAASKLGAESIEIVCDTIRWLPLQVRITQQDLKGRSALYEWITLWKGPYRFDDKWFTLPKTK